MAAEPKKGLASRLYRGEVSVDFIGRRKTWYTISAALLFISLVSLLFLRGFNLGIDFTGGAVFNFPAANASVAEVTEVVKGAGIPGEPRVEKLARGGEVDEYRVQTRELSSKQTEAVLAAVSTKYKVDRANLSPKTVGARWGRQITRKALTSLAVFLLLVIVYISMRFEPKMAAAAIIALIHDIIITAGLYSLVGFEVTPSTVIAFLTILGYSLYDTIVVFDKVKENTLGLLGGSKMSYSGAANLAVNQTIMRSLNTSLISLLPVGALLFVGAGLLGAGTLKDLSLSLFVGIAVGAYSSIFVATPLLAEFKEREPQFEALAKRVTQRQVSAAREPALATAGAADAGASTPASAGATRPVGARGPSRTPKRKGKGGRPGGKRRR